MAESFLPAHRRGYQSTRRLMLDRQQKKAAQEAMARIATQEQQLQADETAAGAEVQMLLEAAQAGQPPSAQEFSGALQKAINAKISGADARNQIYMSAISGAPDNPHLQSAVTNALQKNMRGLQQFNQALETGFRASDESDQLTQPQFAGAPSNLPGQQPDPSPLSIEEADARLRPAVESDDRARASNQRSLGGDDPDPRDGRGTYGGTVDPASEEFETMPDDRGRYGGTVDPASEEFTTTGDEDLPSVDSGPPNGDEGNGAAGGVLGPYGPITEAWQFSPQEVAELEKTNPEAAENIRRDQRESWDSKAGRAAREKYGMDDLPPGPQVRERGVKSFDEIRKITQTPKKFKSGDRYGPLEEVMQFTDSDLKQILKTDKKLYYRIKADRAMLEQKQTARMQALEELGSDDGMNPNQPDEKDVVRRQVEIMQELGIDPELRPDAYEKFPMSDPFEYRGEE